MHEGSTSETSGELIRVAIYARTAQTDNTAIADQVIRCKEAAQGNCWTVVEHIYSDSGVSGMSKANRSGLEALEAAIQKSPRSFDCVITDDTSRLSRNVSQVIYISQSWKCYGVDVYFASQKLHSLDPRFQKMMAMHCPIDEPYVARLRKMVRSGVRGRVLAGYNGGRREF